MGEKRDLVPVLKRMVQRLDQEGHHAYATKTEEAINEIGSLRSDLAEAIALLREAREMYVEHDSLLASPIDDLLARHPIAE